MLYPFLTIYLVLLVVIISAALRAGAFRLVRVPGPLSASRNKFFALFSVQRTASVDAISKYEVLDEIGSGSYGTVHLLQQQGIDGNKCFVGKRAWTEEDLNRLQIYSDQTSKERAQQCRAYWEVEKHCFQKLQKAQVTKGLPNLKTIQKDDDSGYEWMIFDLIESVSYEKIDTDGDDDSIIKPAMSLQQWIELDRDHHHKHQKHHLFLLAQALGIDSEEKHNVVDVDEEQHTASIVATLDAVFEGMLEILAEIHELSIVHRDVKPSNLLVSKKVNCKNGDEGGGNVHPCLYLIDFGSAADLDTLGPLRKNVGLSKRVAISPIYAAPEVFIEANKRQTALKFDCFSAALILCQLLFQYLDERTDAGFHQQLQVAKWNLDAWLATEMAGKVRPAGIDTALQVLSQRPGLWTLLQDMLRPDPWERVDSKTALTRLRTIVRKSKATTSEDVDLSVIAATDGQFLADVLESLEYCTVPDELTPLMLRPLQFVATFKRGEPLGLLLAEPEYVNLKTDFDSEEDRQQWIRATLHAMPGEVYVQGTVPGGQAEALGIFRVGDRIQGVGELPVADQGFEHVIQMIQGDASPDPNYITLHFDRKSYVPTATTAILSSAVRPIVEESVDSGVTTPLLLKEEMPVQVAFGAWSSQGRRKAQEDRFILYELHDAKDRSIILAGVLDGHLGIAASSAAEKQLPQIMSQELLVSPSQYDLERTGEDALIEVLLESSWKKVCDSYRSECGLGDEEGCRVADYDPREGILNANTGASDAVAGTTANLVALDKQTGRLAVLNCGDSRSFVMSEKGIVFESTDHKPERELERFMQARETDPMSLYQMPRCRFSRWYVPVGDYEYAVSRSLEGSYATVRGIVSDADVTVLQAEPCMTVVMATDGLWEIMDTAQVAKIVEVMRFQQGSSASDIAKTLCSMAIERGSSDNVSAVILFLN